MEMRWNLDKLYTSFESSEFADDLKRLDTKITEIVIWSEKSLNDKEDAIGKITWWITRKTLSVIYIVAFLFMRD